MAEEKKSKVIEGEILEEEPKVGKGRQFVTEKMVGVVVLVLAVIIGGYYAYGPVRNWFSSFGTDPLSEPEVLPETTESTEIAELKERLRILESQPAQVETQNLEARLQKIDETLNTLQQNPPGGGEGEAVPDPRIESLMQEVAALKAEIEKRPASIQGSSSTFATALAALSPPLYQSLSFEGELEQVRILALEMSALSQATLSEPLSVLSGFSKTGVPSLTNLKEEFGRASIEALKVEGLASDAGWWDRTWAGIKGLVVVRRTDGTGGTDLDMALFSAEKYLEVGDIKSAIELVSALPAGEAEAFGPWLEEATKREKALDAFGGLVDFIPKTLSSGENN